MARRHLTLRWRLVNPALAARLPAEVLDGVGEIEIRRRDAGVVQQAAQ